MNRRHRAAAFLLLILPIGLTTAPAWGQTPPGERPALKPPRITQSQIASGQFNLHQVRTHGLRIFATPFNKLDGYGDGPINPASTTDPGGRPTLQNNGTFLRANGLDSQTCMECHSILSAATVPFRFGIGGVGGANNNAMGGATEIDVNDSQGNGYAFYNGRFINPPFVLGSGGGELVAKEMTTRLQARKQFAQQNPGTSVPLIAKGVNFGVISFSNGSFDTSGVIGVDPDLVVRPFGRKGEFATVRAFDVGALAFHLGMQPVESVGYNQDADGDGVVNEILIGEVSAMSIFGTNLEPPKRRGGGWPAQVGSQIFAAIGCTDCHKPSMTTQSRMLTYSFPEIETDPSANVFYSVNLRTPPTKFPPSPGGGIRVNMYSDLKRHDMGPALAESTGGALDAQFVTARLWGIADSAPYLHDGRALTLTDAILQHGGEAQQQRVNFSNLPGGLKRRVLSFLRSLRTPRRVAEDLD